MSSIFFVNPQAPRRYLALWFPFLSADRHHRQHPQKDKPSRGRSEPPRVFVEKVKSALRIAAMDRQAQKLGLHTGLALADARARIPHLDVQDMDSAADMAFLGRMADFCDRYTPFVATHRPDGLILDITGCAHLFAGEEGLRDDLRARLQKSGVEVSASIAGTPDTARALAHFGGSVIVPSGAEAQAVQLLPVMALGASPDSISGLTRAGLKTIGDLARQPRQPLAARFGEDLVARLARVLGERDIRIVARRPVLPYMVEQRFADPIGREDDMLATLAMLAQQVAGLLEGRGEGGRYFEASFFRTDGKLFRIAIETGQPQRDPQTIMLLFKQRLAALADPLDPGFGYDLIRLGVSSSDSLEPIQTGLDSTGFEEEEIVALTDRLSTRFGAEAVKRFMAIDTHIPERAMRTVPVMAAPVAGEAVWVAAPPDAMSARPIHMFDPPQAIETLAGVPDGPPLRFRWHRVLHEIARAEGPERIAAEWWRHDGMTRDYYRVEDKEGRRYWVFREGLYGSEAQSPRWFLHGVFP